MEIKKAEFIKSSASSSGFIKSDKPIIAISGKSNVGKSSFINMLAIRKKLAKTSNTPGRTRLINYFDFGEFILADLPGYGFAKAPKTEQQKWAKLMEDFFSDKENLTYCLSLVDIRHDPTREDVQMINYLHHYAIPFTVVATKLDKIGKSMVKQNVAKIANFLSLTPHNIIAVSNEDSRGREDVLSKIEEILTNFNSDRNI